MRDTGHRVLGATILGRAPIGTVNIEFRDGVTALYGKNGAGKTRLLNELAELLRGDGSREPIARSAGPRPARCLHIETPDSERSFAWSIHAALSDQIRGDAARVPDTALDMDPLLHVASELASAGADELLEEAFKIPLPDLTEMFLDAYLGLNDVRGADDTPTLSREIARQNAFALAPSPGQTTGAWRVWISMKRSLPAIDRVWSLWKTQPSGEDEESVLAWVKDLLETTERVGPKVALAISNWLQANPDSPPWVPIPLVEVAVPIWNDTAIRAFTASDSTELDRATLGAVRSEGHLIAMVDDDTFLPTDEARASIASLESRANAQYGALLADAPVLKCVFAHPEDWAYSPPVRWHGADAWSGVLVPVAELSTAQARWAEVAISATLAERDDWVEQTFTLLDEPELALHATAVDHMLGGLKALAVSTGAPVVIATHAPVVLNDPGVHLVHVYRNATGEVETQPLDDPLRLSLPELGISRADLLQIYRVILLVEGEHDRAVLEQLVGNELRQSRTLIVALRGTKSLKAGDAHLLLDYTSASIVLMLDNVRDGVMTRAWARTLDDLRAKGLKQALRTLDQQLPRDDTPEERAMGECLRRALHRGEEDRIEFVGLPVADVVDLLPVKAFVPTADSWASLRREWAKATTTANFKDWLRATYGASVSTRTCTKAACAMEAIPEPIQEVATKCAVASALSWMRATEPPGSDDTGGQVQNG